MTAVWLVGFIVGVPLAATVLHRLFMEVDPDAWDWSDSFILAALSLVAGLMWPIFLPIGAAAALVHHRWSKS